MNSCNIELFRFLFAGNEETVATVFNKTLMPLDLNVASNVIIDSSTSVQQKKSQHKKKENLQHHNKRKLTTSFDDIDEASSDDDFQDSNRDKQQENCVTPSFVSRRLAPKSTDKVVPNKISEILQQLSHMNTKFETLYFRPLLVAQQRNEAMLKSLHLNQQKIQKTLRKQKVTISFI